MTNTNIESFNDSKIPTTIVPWLTVSEIIKAVSFYKSAFNAIETYRLEAPDGSLQVVRFSIADAEFWINEESAEQDNSVLQPPYKSSIRMILTVTDPDTLFAQALQAGAKQVYPVSEQYGWRVGRMADPFGHHWEIGRPVGA